MDHRPDLQIVDDKYIQTYRTKQVRQGAASLQGLPSTKSLQDYAIGDVVLDDIQLRLIALEDQAARAMSPTNWFILLIGAVSIGVILGLSVDTYIHATP